MVNQPLIAISKAIYLSFVLLLLLLLMMMIKMHLSGSQCRRAR
jgi:hypothetical protein